MTRLRVVFIVALLMLQSVVSAQIAPALTNEMVFSKALTSNDGSFLRNVTASWIRSRKETEKEITPLLAEFAASTKRQDLTFEGLLARYTPDQKSPFHEYTENFVTEILSSSDPAPKKDLLTNMRLVVDLDDKILKKLSRKRAVHPSEVDSWGSSRFSLLTDVDAQAVSFMRRKTVSCALDAVTVDPTEQDRNKWARNGYEVVYVLEFWKDHQSMWETFDRLSSPTSQELRAGYYLVWCRRRHADGAIVEGERKKVKITEKQTIDLLVPQGDQGNLAVNAPR
jgi:hypothetical protein